jgi:hypothetical protein
LLSCCDELSTQNWSGQADSDRTTIFWLAPAYEFLLVRFLQEEQSGGFELLLKEAKFRGEVIAGT